MIKLTAHDPVENRDIWINPGSVVYLRANIYGGTFVRMLDGANENVTEQPAEVALLVGSRGRR